MLRHVEGYPLARPTPLPPRPVPAQRISHVSRQTRRGRREVQRRAPPRRLVPMGALEAAGTRETACNRRGRLQLAPEGDGSSELAFA